MILPELLPSLSLLFMLYGEPVPQPPAHVVPSQRVEQPVGDGFIVSIVPKEIKGAVGELIAIKAESGAEIVTWKATAGLRILNDDPPDPSRKSILVHATTGGTFAICCSIPFEKGTRSAIVLVTIGPPEPPPPPPPPPDPLPETLATLYTADPSATKQADALALASVYRGAAKSTVDSPKLTTNGALAKVLAEAAADVVPLPKLESIRKAIQTQVILKQFNSATTELTPALRAEWRVQLQRIASALESIAK